MKRTAAAVFAVVALGAGTVHADDGGGIRWTTPTVSYHTGGTRLAQADPITATFRTNAQFWRCSPANPPRCWHESTLSFWTQVDLQYRHHPMKARSAVSYGVTRWAGWTAKRNRVLCVRGTGQVCGDWMRVPAPKNIWGKRRYYTPTYLPGYFVFRSSACYGEFCGYGTNRSVRIGCIPQAEQCYFDLP